MEFKVFARGSEAEVFLIRIEEGRELFPVNDADLFRCLPFFLSGTALFCFRIVLGIRTGRPQGYTTRRAPPEPEKSLFSELAYRPRKPPRNSRADAIEFSAPAIAGSKRAANRNRVEAVARGTRAPATSGASISPISATTLARTAKCWNCEKTGHIARECHTG
ncbi:hypothetical protein ALC56_00600 [Trachymyrmex septentrionalis]|uniref:CCHC-type domain-containing protein n=1 Tax=Trachymyrmex septentrionalis TaxID=34720 RepID=A0A195FWY3_9HYME|nr:hypothetical protein ALC56_00600 [Trachymyrmex septentrionalis]